MNKKEYINCPNPKCRKQVHTSMAKCPYCGADLTEKESGGGCIGSLVVVIIILLAIFGSISIDEEKNPSNSNIQTEQIENNIQKENDNNITSTEFATNLTAIPIVFNEEDDMDNDVEKTVEIEKINGNNDLVSDNNVLNFLTFKRLSKEIRKVDFDKANEDTEKIIQKIAAFKGKCEYENVIQFVIENNKKLSRKWKKDGRYFENQIEFYEAFISGEYKEIIKDIKNINFETSQTAKTFNIE